MLSRNRGQDHRSGRGEQNGGLHQFNRAEQWNSDVPPQHRDRIGPDSEQKTGSPHIEQPPLHPMGGFDVGVLRFGHAATTISSLAMSERAGRPASRVILAT